MDHPQASYNNNGNRRRVVHTTSRNILNPHQLALHYTQTEARREEGIA